ncbi:hypothetical protein SBRY_30343 [Actinacidiphila bryophytorum]|uniref:Uncharacterized protein n=1 Tax=Actinacidiphila bryophytorum TaxID=1436133 RepID=A0A9W4H0V0_9ACTN|nr:hypothetical protein SBRY_30343 [Actinacidiphila bryophytorum]
MVAAVVGVRRATGRRGHGAYGDERPGRPAGGRAVRRPAAAGLDRDGPGPGHRPAAARRAHDLPRHRPPGRGARPGAPPQPGARAYGRGRAARPQPGRPLRRPPRRDEGRPDRRRGSARRGRHGGAGARGVRPRVGRGARPGDRQPAGGAGAALAARGSARRRGLRNDRWNERWYDRERRHRNSASLNGDPPCPASTAPVRPAAGTPSPPCCSARHLRRPRVRPPGTATAAALTRRAAVRTPSTRPWGR